MYSMDYIYNPMDVTPSNIGVSYIDVRRSSYFECDHNIFHI